MRREYKNDEIAFLKEISPGKSYNEIADAFNARFKDRDYVLPRQVRDAMKYREIPYIGKPGRFQPGVATRHVPVGSVIMAQFGKRKNGERYTYEMVKVKEPNVWKKKSLLVWESIHGSLPDGKMIIFLDGNTLNSDIENLYAVSSGVHFRLNKYRVMKPNREYMLAAIKIAEIEDTIESIKKKNRNRNSRERNLKPKEKQRNEYEL